jgi:hypothetical protein
LTVIKGAAGAFHFFQDVVGSGGPDEWFRAFVVTVDVGADGHDEFLEIAKDAAAQTILGEVTKETLHHVEPRRTGGSEVQMESRMSRQPALYLGVLMGGNGLVDQAKKLEPFLMAMPLLAQTKDLAVGGIDLTRTAA